MKAFVARLLRMPALPLFIFFFGIVISMAVSWQLTRITEARSQARFYGLVESTLGAINAKIDTQMALLRSTAGLYASDDAVSPAEFAAYIDQLNLEHNYPGMQGIGYSRYSATRADLRWVTQWMHGDGGDPEFKIWPDGDRAGYSSILYLRPSSDRNRSIIGFDMMSERQRRLAMMRAARTGELTMTGKVDLLHTAGPKRDPGFLIYLPIYQNNPAEAAKSPSERTLRGWVYSPLRASDLFDAIFRDRQHRDVATAIYAGAPEKANLLYQTGVASPDPRYRLVAPLNIAGQHWAVEIITASAFEADSPLTLPVTAGLAGIVVSILLAALSAMQVRMVQRTELQVQQRTAQLTAANQQIREESAQREAAEAQVRQMQKVEALGQLTGGVAHDFNNMLAIIIGNLDLAKRRIAQPERLERLINQAMEGATRAAALTQRLLAFARRQALVPEPLDANELVSGMSDMLRRTLGETVRLQTVLNGKIWRLYADAGQLENAIINLAVNARDAMPEGGRLTIETSNAQIDTAYAQAQGDLVPGDYVMLSVADTGTGMEHAVLERAVDPFFTTKSVDKGTGLGLSQVYGFVQQSGGHLKLESQVGQGTCITIYLPRFNGPDSPVTEAPSNPDTLPPGRPEEVILVVEDEERVRVMSVETLRELGYSVIHAAGGGEAMKLLEGRPDVSLLFTDVVMPDMNGRKLADAALVLRPDLKLCFTTGYTREAIIPDGKADSGTALLPKPFTVSQLANKIRSVLDS